ncbi:subtilisin-like protease [Trametopsis cervina]|nr:subtilisin-like protease [Trametopsis cervina]
MRSSALLTFLSFVAIASAAAPTRYVVELDNLQVLQNGKRAYGSPHDVLYHALRKRGVSFDVSREFNTDGVFVGASLDLSPEDIAEVAKLPGVLNIRPVVQFSKPKPIGMRVVNGTDPSLPDGETTHIQTGVDKVHAQGITGKGIKIGIIDTGIDYRHPFLGAGFGPGHKVIGGWDFVGDAFNGNNTPQPDADPLDTCQGHGTHVAGIIGANPGNEFGISGVAYDASISAYRIFGCTGVVGDDIIIDALLRGFSEGNDILTLSLGGPSGWSESSSAVVASRLEDKGAVVTVAQGNDGVEGSWAASSPGTGLDNFAVASVDNLAIPVQNATLHGVDHAPVPYLSGIALNVTDTRPIYATSTNTSDPADACNPLPDSTPDLSGKVVIVRRGTCAFVTKLQNIADKGGNAVLIYNNIDAWAAIDVGAFRAALISPEDGAFLVQQFAAGKDVTITFPQSGASFNLPDVHGGLISDFSTYGPSNQLDFKPSIAAPGGNILSTWPINLGSWAVLSGTSMATPFVAGSAALVLQAKGKSSVKGIRDLLQSNASPIGSTKTDGDPLQTLSLQGAGLIQVASAINSKTIVSPATLLLNDTTHLKPLQTFTIKNTGSSSVTYKLKHVPAGTAASVESKSIFPAAGPVALTKEYATVLLSQSQVTVRPGGSAIVLATFFPPKVADPTTFPVYTGYIEIASGSEIQRVSYLGLANSLKAKQVLDTTDEFFGFTIPAVTNVTGDPHVNASYTLKGDDQPVVLWRLVFGSPQVRFDLVPSNFNAPKKRGLLDWLFGGSLGSVKTLGTLFEGDFVSRNYLGGTSPDTNGWNEFALNGTFADGTTIKDGSYKIFLRALRVTGNPNVNSDFDSWVSPTITIKRK